MSTETKRDRGSKISGTVALGEPFRRLAEALRQPIYNRVLKRDVGRGDTDYEIYLQTSALLSAQTPTEELVCSDELMFQIVHQAQELWLKLIGHESIALVAHLDSDRLVPAMASLGRMVRIMEQLAEEMSVLDTLTPSVFLVIRRYLGEGSGQQSPGWNQLHVSAEFIDGAITRALLRRGLALSDVYGDERRDPELLRICELITDLDAAHQRWMTRHFLLVRRTIGVSRTVRALDGFPTKALATRMLRPLFPALWDVRVELTNRWDRAGGTKPGERRG